MWVFNGPDQKTCTNLSTTPKKKGSTTNHPNYLGTYLPTSLDYFYVSASTKRDAPCDHYTSNCVEP